MAGSEGDKAGNAASSSSTSKAVPDGPVVHTSCGSLRGLYRGGDCCVFRGIPYAAPPERFKRPEPPVPWEEELDCTRYRKIAVQQVFKVNSLSSAKDTIQRLRGKQPPKVSEATSEDCLHLNISTPSLTGSAPVLCWIHGGAYILGAGSEPLYRGLALTKQEGVVVVTINYRLGCFGFLTLPGGDSNCGIWDQRRALQWIQDEIHSFGGDRERVTIIGESAGGMSCGVLLTSPLTQSLFKRAILMSGALSNVMRKQDSEEVAQKFSRQVGVEDDVDIESLKNASTEALFVASQKVIGLAGHMPWQPCVDGELIPELPLEALAKGTVDLSSKQVIIGHTANEWNFFKPLPSSVNALLYGRKPLADFVGKHATTFAEHRMGAKTDAVVAEEVREIMKILRQDRGSRNWAEAEKDFLTMLVFSAPAKLAADALSGAAERVFLYSFDFDAGRMGAAHATELALLFGMHRKHWILSELSGAKKAPEAADAVSRAMIASFGSFARTGQPMLPDDGANTNDNALSWPAYRRGAGDEARPVFVFDRQCRLSNEPCETALERVANLLRSVTRPFGVTVRDQPQSRL
eukprot:TRINITY_DN37463_c0_g1_i1.p1 TRINITY_DN37463_c0_g1~~TRINITY_DN37463_c0_g1_i1.p1  ORF type:complete len:577 (-),score=107.19 TRINITY_DN37463_c0_g1_i1:126-1856(-)